MPGVKRQFITLDQEDQATEDFEGDVFSGEDQSGDDEEFDMGSASEEEEQQTSMMSLIKSGTGGKKALLRGPGSAAPVAKAKKATPQDLTAEDVNEDEETTVSIPVKKNKQRVLLLSSRGITYRFRHLLNDLSVLMPHSKRDTKLDLKGNLETLNELSELANCNNCVFFEIRKHSDLYLWLAKTPNGPSAKFLIQNIHTMDELKLTGNCLKGSRPLLSFDKGFDGEPHWRLVKEMLTQVFGTPKSSRKIKPFFDHVISFTLVDGKVWFRHYQMQEKVAADATSAAATETTTETDGKKAKKVKKSKTDDEPEMSLIEIGPRFVMNLIRIFDGSFGGSTLFENPSFVSPNTSRRLLKMEKMSVYKARLESAGQRDEKGIANVLPADPLADVFK